MHISYHRIPFSDPLFVFPGGRGRPRKTAPSLHQEKALHDNRNHHCHNEFSMETDDEKELSGKYVQQHAVQMSKFWFFFSPVLLDF